MKLNELLKNVTYEWIQGRLDRDVEVIHYDSREVCEPNALFVAVCGFETDGHQYVAAALAAGATVLIVERDMQLPEPVTILKVKDARVALAQLSAAFYRHPTEQMHLIGITGTNGKTSTAWMIKSIYEQTEGAVGCISTLGTFIGQDRLPQSHTTPEAPVLQRRFHQMKEAGIDHCVMEVSSHALHLHRVDGSLFDTAVFTNLTPDHLELHQTMERYYETKAKLFAMTSKHNIINIDDPYGRRLADACGHLEAEYITYGIENDADLTATTIHYGEHHAEYLLHTPSGTVPIRVPLPGRVNIYNSLAAAATAYADGIPLQIIQKGLGALRGIKGRFEVVHQDAELKVVVDFAHTEDGLEQALRTLRPYVAGRLIVVFGVYADDSAAGRAKRLAMGRVADRWADLAVITTDNPKCHSPAVSISDILTGMDPGRHLAYADRKQAIEAALQLSRRGDVILLAGKGHETVQKIGNAAEPFHEAEIVQAFVQQRRTTHDILEGSSL